MRSELIHNKDRANTHTHEKKTANVGKTKRRSEYIWHACFFGCGISQAVCQAHAHSIASQFENKIRRWVISILTH